MRFLYLRIFAFFRGYPYDSEAVSHLSHDRSDGEDSMGQSSPHRPVPPLDADATFPRSSLTLTRFIGRRREQAAVTRLLATTRLLTLTGSGGCGKTRLALAVASVAAPPLVERGAVWLVELASLTDPALVPGAVAAALEVRETPGTALVESLVAALAPRAALLVLDNCEHLIAACAALVARLLAACPRLRVLATSREALRVPGEVTWRVPPLALPDADDAITPTRLMRSEAAQLFADRARARQPDFAVTPANAAAVAAICRQLDGMPLALELAAARTGALSVAHIAARLDDALALLTTGTRTALPRQQTLRATLAWSDALLDAGERAVLRRLSVFAGGWTPEAAEAVCAGAGVTRGDVLALLTQLVDKSLVVMEAETTAGAARYRLLEVVRQYAAAQLAAHGEEAATRRAHTEWFSDLAYERADDLVGPTQAAWLERLERDHDNYRAALRWCLDTREIAQGIRICWGLWRFWFARGYLREGGMWMDAFLVLDRDAGHTAVASSVRLDLLFAAGNLAYQRGDIAASEARFTEMLAVARARDDSFHTATALTWIGNSATYCGEFTTARARYEEALAIRRAIGDMRDCAVLYGALSQLMLFTDEFAQADAYCTESVTLLRQVGDDIEDGYGTSRWGVIALSQGYPTLAHTRFVEALTVMRRTHDRRGIVSCLEGVALLATAWQDAARALCFTGAAANLRRASGIPIHPVWQEWLAHALAPARQMLSETEQATAEAAGAALSLDAAIAAALALPVPSRTETTNDATLPPDAPMPTRVGLLSKRERDVAAQVARHRSNREIADALFIAEKTVEMHVSSALRKCGVSSRDQLAAWAIAAGLAPPLDPDPSTTEAADQDTGVVGRMERHHTAPA